MSAQPLSPLAPEHYLEIDRKADYKSEYYRGVMYAMAGGTYNHGLIILNTGAEIRQALGDRPCSVTSVDVRLRVAETGLFTYPDLMVVCGDPAFADNRKDTILNPIVIAEVLSPSTEAHDRGFKFAHYRRIAALQEYLLVSQSEPNVERYVRQPDGQWMFSETRGYDGILPLESLGCAIPLSGIY
ncbi:MAG: Uma2 family endonuclease, partial [Bryobacteraceae bacterium]